MRHIACFISPHGYGHATRTIAVLESLRQHSPDIQVELFTTVPENLFRSSLADYTYHPIITDVGFIQHNALHENIAETITHLGTLLPFHHGFLDTLALRVTGCDCILCDIAPLGIAVAQRANIPSVLLENFTWDWIYEPYLDQHPALSSYSRQLKELFTRANYHIQAEPICRKTTADLSCSPIYRRAQTTPENIKRSLKTDGRKLVVVTLGGIDFHLPSIHYLTKADDCFFVLAGQQESRNIGENVFLLARDSAYYHPDIIQAADLVLCKSGYSTVAECCQAGTRIACISRDAFPESAVLAEFVRNRLHGTVLDQKTFLNGDWLTLLPTMLATRPPEPFSQNGADSVAAFLLSLF